MRIAIVDDNKALAKGIAWRMQDRGHATDLLHDGLEAADFLRSDANDIVILDINLPGLDGLAILREMRLRGDQRPVLLLTARDKTSDRVHGLDAGADDYLVKPFEMDELEARVRALSRRIAQAPQVELALGKLRFMPETRQVELDGKLLALPRREISVLEALLRARGGVVSKGALLDQVYGTGADVGETSIEAHVSRLRKKLAPAALDIRVQRGLGYSLQERI
ncbi:response regulator transcription factor [Oceanicola sp. D3]|uniref:response regulator transcription factor n=1 Tax=Oceanicola sp. D3 TaxID=2587163 RepID=UPI0011219D69|nr:response regulator transcription factor [Oceanicola sp. D3]QDC10280.1 response regulator transcription factor [Oceanicola sp. D3]